MIAVPEFPESQFRDLRLIDTHSIRNAPLHHTGAFAVPYEPVDYAAVALALRVPTRHVRPL